MFGGFTSRPASMVIVCAAALTSGCLEFPNVAPPESSTVRSSEGPVSNQSPRADTPRSTAATPNDAFPSFGVAPAPDVAAPAVGSVRPVDWSPETISEETGRVHLDLMKMHLAYTTNDVDTLMAMIPPELFGPLADSRSGRDDIRRGLQQTIDEMQQDKIEMSPWQPGELTFLESPHYEFVIVPVQSEWKRKSQVADSSTVYLGRRRRGEVSWRYADVSRMRRANQNLIPEFPADYLIPLPKQTLRK